MGDQLIGSRAPITINLLSKLSSDYKLSLTTSCGCLKLDVNEAALNRGEKVSVAATVRVPVSPGRYEAAISFVDEESAGFKVVVHGNACKPFVVSPSKLEFDSAKQMTPINFTISPVFNGVRLQNVGVSSLGASLGNIRKEGEVANFTVDFRETEFDGSAAWAYEFLSFNVLFADSTLPAGASTQIDVPVVFKDRAKLGPSTIEWKRKGARWECLGYLRAHDVGKQSEALKFVLSSDKGDSYPLEIVASRIRSDEAVLFTLRTPDLKSSPVDVSWTVSVSLKGNIVRTKAVFQGL
jgi:hypothetical protein